MTARGREIFGCLIFILAIIFFVIHGQMTVAATSDIVLNEIAAYEPSGCEWVEIVNTGTEPVNIEGWKFWENTTNHGLTISSSSANQDWVIDPGEYALIVQDDSKLFSAACGTYSLPTGTVFDSSWTTLSETGESIGLKDAAGNMIEQFTYVSATEHSLERVVAVNFDYTMTNWLEHATGNTFGQINSRSGGEASPINQPPVAIIAGSTNVTVGSAVTLDGSASFDPDGSVVQYLWQANTDPIGIGAVISYTYATVGEIRLTLTVTDNAGATSTATMVVTVGDVSMPTSAASTTNFSQIRINEFVADPNVGDTEWIELYNSGATTVNVSGVTIRDGVGLIASPTGTIAGSGFFVVGLSGSHLNNDGDNITLVSPTGTTIDTVSYGNWNDGNMSDNAPAVGRGNAVARHSDGGDSDQDTVDFAETTTVTKGQRNVITVPVIVTPVSGSGGGGTFSGFVSTVFPSMTAVRINEIFPIPGDGEEEFVELYNTSDGSITLTGWWLEDGSETKTSINAVIAAKGFFVIAKPHGNLNNTGDMVLLQDATGRDIDRVAYGDFDDGNVYNNAPTPIDGASLVRMPGADSGNNATDFALTSVVTKGIKNTVMAVVGPIKKSSVRSPISLSELLPNPVGSDDATSTEEFIELQNTSSSTIDLSNWTVTTRAQTYRLTGVSMSADAYLVLPRSQTHIVLHNSGSEEVTLVDAQGNKMDSVIYRGAIGEGVSYVRGDAKEWLWSVKPTPGVANIFWRVNQSPVIAIDVDPEVGVGEQVLFDATDTFDPDADALTFVWHFSNGTGFGKTLRHAFTRIGTEHIELVVSDEKGHVSSERVTVKVKDRGAFVGGMMSSDGATAEQKKIRITEIFPNPSDAETNEFIELFNPTTEDVEVGGLQLDDEAGGSHPYVIPDGTILLAHDYLVVFREESALILNNSSDSARLLGSDNTVIQEVAYHVASEGGAYAEMSPGAWAWTSVVTPGSANVGKPLKQTQAAATKRNVGSGKIKTVLPLALEKLSSADVGDSVRVSGTVVVLPGVYRVQYFYIAGYSASSSMSGVQLYSQKKNFPALRLGDVVTAEGVVAEQYGEKKINIPSDRPIIIDKHGAALAPFLVSTGDIDETMLGGLVQVTGEVTQRKSTLMYIDDGNDELQITVKKNSGIDTKKYHEGEQMTVVGIVGKSKDGFHLLPRGEHDMIPMAETTSTIASAGIKNDHTLAAADSYLTATAGGLTTLILGLLARTRGPLAVSFAKRASGGVIAMIRRKRMDS